MGGCEVQELTGKPGAPHGHWRHPGEQKKHKAVGEVGPPHGASYLTGKLWSGLILSNKLYSCGRNVSWDHSAFLNVRVRLQIGDLTA